MSDQIAHYIRLVLESMGEDIKDSNLVDTPEKVREFLQEFTNKKDTTPEDILSPVFPETHDELIMVRGIGFTALCAHHLLPFRGTAAVGYIPDSTGVVGLSKLARLVEFFARRITVQERITNQIVDALTDVLKPLGAMTVIKAEHQCMTIRGVKDPNTDTITSAVRGVFLSNEKNSKDEFLRLLSI